MSFWKTVTLTIDYDDETVEADNRKLQEKSLQYIEKENGSASSYITHGGDVFIKPSNIKVKEMLKELTDYWSRAVVIHAEDTGDMGTAELYVKTGDYELKPRVRDRYEEMQRDRTDDTGRRAAAYMMFAHGINAQADYYNRWRNTEKSTGEQKK